MINEEDLKEWLREYIVRADYLEDIVLRTIYDDCDDIDREEMQVKKELVEKYNEVRSKVLDIIPMTII